LLVGSGGGATGAYGVENLVDLALLRVVGSLGPREQVGATGRGALLLHRRSPAVTRCAAIVAGEEPLGRVAGNDCIGDGIGVLLVDVAGHSDAILELDSGSLLHDMGRLVRDGMQRRRGAGKRNLVTSRVGFCAERLIGGRRLGSVVSLDGADVEAPEGCLHLIEGRQGAAARRHASSSGLVRAVTCGRCAVGVELERLHECVLAHGGRRGIAVAAQRLGDRALPDSLPFLGCPARISKLSRHPHLPRCVQL
jgi:hypothetical protein